jgi:4-oxalomesaconate tautomerase
LMAKLEKIRLEAGQKMGLGDVSNSVLPKIGLLSKPKSSSNNIQSLYFTPKTLHPAHAVTGAICVGTALKIKGSVASEVGTTNGVPSEVIIVEHPSGVIEVKLEIETTGDKINVKRAGTIRTVRKIMEGAVFH